MANHLFEGLMKWEDSGVEVNGSDGTANSAQLAPGQAESYEKTENEDGTVTYTFKLRDGIKWSDGKDVTAGDFEYAWKRLVDPATAADYSYMLDCVVMPTRSSPVKKMHLNWLLKQLMTKHSK